MAAVGALALIPLAAVAVPASADVPLQPTPGDVAWPHHPNNPNNGWWDNDNDWRHRHDRDDWNHDNDWNRWNNGPDCWWRNALPRTGSF
ncbi:hypothetical protein D7D52_08645 [Nocardia yunnanensis]|uniref:Secreted protein n=1 Tax=Nocardia yunnanensis TaxID=2382165 RepID=A0A386ZBP2_9NOCA|nr:hypothetical protein D7D52_08645 [Nocardia yunnanensis]